MQISDGNISVVHFLFNLSIYQFVLFSCALRFVYFIYDIKDRTEVIRTLIQHGAERGGMND